MTAASLKMALVGLGAPDKTAGYQMSAMPHVLSEKLLITPTFLPTQYSVSCSVVFPLKKHCVEKVLFWVLLLDGESHFIQQIHIYL